MISLNNILSTDVQENVCNDITAHFTVFPP